MKIIKISNWVNKKNILLISLLSLVALAARFLPHIPNFAPLYSVMLFAGVYSDKKRYFFIPLIALLASDIFIGFYKWQIMLSVYLSFIIIAFLGAVVKKHKNIINIISSTLASSIIFFLFTNLAVWYFGSWYSHDLAGLNYCYYLALPFFKSTLLSSLAYSGLLFGIYEAIHYALKNKKIVFNK